MAADMITVMAKNKDWEWGLDLDVPLASIHPAASSPSPLILIVPDLMGKGYGNGGVVRGEACGTSNDREDFVCAQLFDHWANSRGKCVVDLREN